MNSFKSSSLKEIASRSIACGKRLDSRESLEMRPLEILPSSVSPSLLAKLGNTQVLCNVRASVTEPHPIRQNEGFLVFKVNLDILKGVSGLRKTSKQLSNDYAEILEKTIRDSK